MEREVIGTLWKGLYIAVLNCSVFNTSVAKTFPLHCFLGWPCFIQFDSVFQPLKIYTNNNTDFCLHSTYNIKSKALVHIPALLRATAGGRCGK